VRFGDVGNPEDLKRVGFAQPVDVVVSCLASRTGGKARARDHALVVRVTCPCSACGRGSVLPGQPQRRHGAGPPALHKR